MRQAWEMTCKTVFKVSDQIFLQILNVQCLKSEMLTLKCFLTLSYFSMFTASKKMWRENYTPYEAENWHDFALVPDLCFEPTFKNVNCILQCEMCAIQKLTFHMTCSWT